MQKIHYLKLSFIFISFIQLFVFESFWTSGALLFLTIMALFKINWFYLQSYKYNRIFHIIIGCLLVINLFTLPMPPYFLIGLFFIDLLDLFAQEWLLAIGGIFSLLVLLVVGVTHSLNPGLLQIYALIVGISIACIYLQVNNLKINELEKESYHYTIEFDQMQRKNEALRAQAQSSKETYILQERNRISREIHDSAGHVLSTVIVQLEAIETLSKNDAPQASAMAGKLRDFTKNGLDNVRQIIHKLKPDNYEKIAFVEMLTEIIENFEANTNIRVIFNKNETRWIFSDKQQELIFQVIQESLSNSAKYSQASEIRILMHYTDELLILSLADNGIGTDIFETGFGLENIRERVHLLGGKVTFTTSAGNGFTTRIVLNKLTGGRYD